MPTISFPLLVALAAAGGLGTLARFGIGWAFARVGGIEWTGAAGFPFATLTINVVGALAFGVIWGMAEGGGVGGGGGGRISPGVRLVLLTGFLGGFTTFSAFAGEVGQMVHEGRMLPAAIYVAASNTLAIAGAIGGVWIGHKL